MLTEIDELLRSYADWAVQPAEPAPGELRIVRFVIKETRKSPHQSSPIAYIGSLVFRPSPVAFQSPNGPVIGELAGYGITDEWTLTNDPGGLGPITPQGLYARFEIPFGRKHNGESCVVKICGQGLAGMGPGDVIREIEADVVAVDDINNEGQVIGWRPGLDSGDSTWSLGLQKSTV